MGSYFQCNLNTPKKGLVIGADYTITVTEALGTGFITAPAVGSGGNPLHVSFK
jgi:hypothetical protein